MHKIEERLIIRKWNDRGFSTFMKTILKREKSSLFDRFSNSSASAFLTFNVMFTNHEENTAGDREVPGKRSDREGY